jgi:bacterioferritin-associated ferredoxin
MYICLCKGITEEKIENLVNLGLPTSEVIKRLGLGSDCGICVVDAVQKIQSKAASNQRQSKK